MKDYSEPEPTESVIKRYREIQNTYPEGHRERVEIERQIEAVKNERR